jgi:organic hydroperoxide reductase OsmC/OhrA
MGQPRPKVFAYEIEVDRDGRTAIPGDPAHALPSGWTPDHLLLAALVRCSIKSLEYHARRAGIEVQAAGSASGRVTKRESDGRYAFVEIACTIDVELVPLPAATSDLFLKAQRDCFVGATLTVEPRYEWRVA